MGNKIIVFKIHTKIFLSGKFLDKWWTSCQTWLTHSCGQIKKFVDTECFIFCLLCITDMIFSIISPFLVNIWCCLQWANLPTSVPEKSVLWQKWKQKGRQNGKERMGRCTRLQNSRRLKCFRKYCKLYVAERNKINAHDCKGTLPFGT